MTTTEAHVDILKMPTISHDGRSQVATIPLSVIRTAAANVMELTVEFDTDGHFVACRYAAPQFLAAARAAGVSG